MESARENSVRHLEDLYTVVVGLSLSIAIYKVIDNTLLAQTARFWIIPFFLSFIITLIPFYHGALRHLDATYIEQRKDGNRKGALILDFLLLFIESCLFIALAVLLPTPIFFIWCFAILMGVDVVWGFVAHLAFTHDIKSKPESKWALINLVCGSLIVIGICIVKYAPDNDKMSLMWIGTLVLTAVRTVFDYLLCWDIYFPKNEIK